MKSAAKNIGLLMDIAALISRPTKSERRSVMENKRLPPRLQFIDEVMDERAKNWGRWALDRKHYQHCDSAEGLYLQESDLNKSRDPVIKVDLLDALAFERACCGPSMPTDEKELLRRHYIWRWDYRRICQKLGYRYVEYDLHLAKALRMIKNRLDLQNLGS